MSITQKIAFANPETRKVNLRVRVSALKNIRYEYNDEQPIIIIQKGTEAVNGIALETSIGFSDESRTEEVHLALPEEGGRKKIPDNQGVLSQNEGVTIRIKEIEYNGVSVNLRFAAENTTGEASFAVSNIFVNGIAANTNYASQINGSDGTFYAIGDYLFGTTENWWESDGGLPTPVESISFTLTVGGDGVETMYIPITLVFDETDTSITEDAGDEDLSSEGLAYSGDLGDLVIMKDETEVHLPVVVDKEQIFSENNVLFSYDGYEISIPSIMRNEGWVIFRVSYSIPVEIDIPDYIVVYRKPMLNGQRLLTDELLISLRITDDLIADGEIPEQIESLSFSSVEFFALGSDSYNINELYGLIANEQPIFLTGPITIYFDQ